MTISPQLPAQPRAVTRKRDQQERRRVTKFAREGNLSDLRYRPALRLLARNTLLVDRLYLALKDRELMNDDGSAISAVDTFRRLCDSQGTLLKALGLTPTSVLPNDRAGSLDAVFERIARTKKVRDKEPDAEPTPSEG
jgi:hypothetical protein